MRTLIQYIRQCFCKHNIVLLRRAIIYEKSYSKMPCGEQIIYRCDKCGYVQRIDV